MSSLDEIAARKQELLDRSEAERNSITRSFYQWQARTHSARQVSRIVKHPLFLLGLGLFAWRMPWRKCYKVGGWAWKGWRLVRTIRRMWM